MARRDDVAVQSCPLCLRPDEAASMVAIAMPYLTGLPTDQVLLCRQCARSIADTWDRLVFEESRAEVHSDAHLIRVSPAGDRAPAGPETVSALVPEGEPGGGSPGINRGEPGTDASGETVPVEPQSAAAESDLERSENSGK
jgi:hypothetical protein